MKKQIISVIIPVYNVEKYLEQCIESVIHQTYDQLEIILINDGSTDHSSEICDKYAKKDNRIKTIHKENGGVSSARNAGLRIATGDYITFVDSDDYLESKCFERLYNGINEKNVDVSVVGWKDQDGKTGAIGNCVAEDSIVIFEKDEIPEISIIGMVTGHLFKKEYIKNIYFDEGIFYSEDTLFTVKSLYETSAKSILVIGEPLYVYKMNRKSSAINCPFSEKQLTIIKAYDQMLECVKFYTGMCDLIIKIKKMHCYRMYREVLKLDYKHQYKKSYQILKKEMIRLRKEGYIPSDNKENIIEFLYLYFYKPLCYYIRWKNKRGGQPDKKIMYVICFS